MAIAVADLVEDFRGFLEGEQAAYSEAKLTRILNNAVMIVKDLAYPFYPDRFTLPLSEHYTNNVFGVALEIVSKEGGEGQTSNSANGSTRVWETGDISHSIKTLITPYSALHR